MINGVQENGNDHINQLYKEKIGIAQIDDQRKRTLDSPKISDEMISRQKAKAMELCQAYFVNNQNSASPTKPVKKKKQLQQLQDRKKFHSKRPEPNGYI